MVRFSGDGLPRGADTLLLLELGGPSRSTLDWWKVFPQAGSAAGRGAGVTRELFEQLWDQSVEQFSSVLATDNPDLTVVS
jgi:hypothetical protein